MKIYPHGKDKIVEPLIELDDGTLLTQTELLANLTKSLQEKVLITISDVKTK